MDTVAYKHLRSQISLGNPDTSFWDLNAAAESGRVLLAQSGRGQAETGRQVDRQVHIVKAVRDSGGQVPARAGLYFLCLSV